MSVLPLSPREQEVVDTYRKNDYNTCAVARELKITRSTVRNHLVSAKKKGWLPPPETGLDQAPIGFGVTKSTIQINKDGEIVQQWARVSPIDIERTEDYFRQRIPAAPILSSPTVSDNAHLALEIVVPDLHIGMLAWERETGGNYDIKIARDLMLRLTQKIIDHFGRVKKVFIVPAGDTTHIDNRSQQTEKGKHIQDTDSRFDKILDVSQEVFTTMIDRFSSVAEEVHYCQVPGNHDWHTASFISRVLAAHYRLSPQILIDTTPGKHKFYRWGGSFFAVSHGDTANKSIANWALWQVIEQELVGVKRVYVRTGHIHKETRKPMYASEDVCKVMVESFPTLVAPDAWTTEMGLMSARAAVATLFDERYGDICRRKITYQELMGL